MKLDQKGIRNSLDEIKFKFLGIEMPIPEKE
jgi:hypothetical protein